MVFLRGKEQHAQPHADDQDQVDSHGLPHVVEFAQPAVPDMAHDGERDEQRRISADAFHQERDERVALRQHAPQLARRFAHHDQAHAHHDAHEDQLHGVVIDERRHRIARQDAGDQIEQLRQRLRRTVRSAARQTEKRKGQPLCLCSHRGCPLEANDDIRFGQIDDLFESIGRFNSVKSELKNGEHSLQDAKIIEHVCEDGIACTTRYKLTESAKRTLLAEIKIDATAEKLADVIDANTFAEKQLFFPKDIQRQVDELEEFLQPDKYNQIRQRMKEQGFRSGFACLFYGSPGTGKTETVNQLARKTGRNIMLVDVPRIKSKWVGESEKNIKALFDRYRELVKRAKLTPILLFNEADAIIGKRKNGAENAVDKMENSLQNIILQEMENLDGIMIATTNLQQNMDKAFERRFLYKIKFDKPTEEARSYIWRSMIPDLCDNDIHVLAEKYDFSGGQIENIARRHAIDTILHGSADNNLESLILHCDNEKISGKEQRRIGF